MGHSGLHEDLPEQMIADFVTSLPLGLHSPIAPSSGIHLEALMIFQKVEYWYGPRGIPTHVDIVIPFTVFSVGTRAVSDMAFLVCNLARSLITDKEPNAKICSLSFEVQENKGVGYVAFTGVSPFWFKRAETTPMFDVMQDSPDSFIMTWPLFRDDLTYEFHICLTGAWVTQMPKQDTKISMYMVSKPAKKKFHEASVGAGSTTNATQQVTMTLLLTYGINSNVRGTLGNFSSLHLEVLEEIMKHLLPVALDSLDRSCRMFQIVADTLLAHWHTFKHAMGRFFTGNAQIREFRDLMKATGLLVSGEVALDFFVHATTATELHALSQVLQCPIVGEWLLTRRYVFAPNVSQLDSFQDDIALFESTYVIDMTPVQHEDNEEVRNFHVECIVASEMNVLSHEAAYCLFPLMTLVQKRTILIGLQSPMNKSENLAIRKQSNRGLEVIHNPSALDCANITSVISFLSPRHIGDEHCYIVPFENTANNTRQPDFLDCHSCVEVAVLAIQQSLEPVHKPRTCKLAANVNVIFDGLPLVHPNTAATPVTWSARSLQQIKLPRLVLLVEGVINNRLPISSWNQPDNLTLKAVQKDHQNSVSGPQGTPISCKEVGDQRSYKDVIATSTSNLSLPEREQAKSTSVDKNSPIATSVAKDSTNVISTTAEGYKSTGNIDNISESSQSEDDDGQGPWTVVQPRRARSLENLKTIKLRKGIIRPTDLSQDQVNMIKEAEKTLTPAQKESVRKRAEKVKQIAHNEFASPIAGPSYVAKGKFTDNNKDVSDEELDLQFGMKGFKPEIFSPPQAS
ncbi:hypothetical protein C8J55DRAFT_485855 [Lentinula edodes]|uniref:Uncharacterized protein n=1 Tax=Lentinula lateritia TaxID=40482 RepID=A0A9W9AZP9_9AGAR|nr:hypothetical protein C8J55DRAFT_485855 [Lentinula edodes]